MSTLKWRKTKLCKYDVMGFCTKGRTCNYAHGASELANMTPPTPLSSTANAGMQTATGGCTSLPWDSDARAAVFPVMPKKKFHKTKICSFFVAGCCKKGSRCNFAHCTNELQPPPVDRFATPGGCDFSEDNSFKGISSTVQHTAQDPFATALYPSSLCMKNTFLTFADEEPKPQPRRAHSAPGGLDRSAAPPGARRPPAQPGASEPQHPWAVSQPRAPHGGSC